MQRQYNPFFTSPCADSIILTLRKDSIILLYLSLYKDSIILRKDSIILTLPKDSIIHLYLSL